MKKKILSGIIAAVVTFNVALFSVTTVFGLPPAGGGTCKVEVIDCPGWGTGDRQICHVNGTGLACTCGDSTKCP